MKRKTLFLLSILTISATLLSGCKSADSPENSETIETTAIDSETTEGTEDSQVVPLPWLQLASLETHPELRSAFEEYVGVTGETGNKEGYLYKNPLTKQPDQNITLLLAIKNNNFNGYIVAPDSLSKFGEIAAENYTDVEADDPIAPYATVNAYFELLPDQTEGQFDGDSSISRAQAMTLVMRAITPVNESQAPETDADFTSKVGESIYTDFAAPMNEFAYINTSNGLDAQTFDTTMSRGEYIYMLANYFNTDRKEVLNELGYQNDIYDEDVTISTVSDAGDISFSEAIADSSKGVPSDMYKTFQVAINMNLITESDLEDWDSAITKGEAVRLFTSMSINYYQGAGELIMQSIPYEEQDHPDVNPEDVDPKTTQMTAETATALSHVEGEEIDAKYGSAKKYTDYAISQGADSTRGWCWVYYTGQGAGNQESYAVYMKEDSPRYGEVFHLGDYLPCGQFFTGANNEEHGIADIRLGQRQVENGERDGITFNEDGTVTIVID